MYNSCRGIRTVRALKADFSAKVRGECVTSPGFLCWFVSHEPVFGHQVLVPGGGGGGDRGAGNETKGERGEGQHF